MKALRLGLPLWALVSASLFNCSADKAPARGQIMLALQTDMALPQDINRVRLQVLSEQGRVEFDQTFTVGAKGQARIPATFAIVAPEGRAARVEVRLIGFNAQGPRTFNKTITTVPRDRIATLRMPIQWLCDDSVVDLGENSYESKCAPIGDEEAACRAGTCQKVSVREDTLPTFAPPDVFGGGNDPDDASGQCFDTVACFNLGLRVVPDEQCRVQLSAPAALPINFALRPSKPDEGICGAAHDCYVPLDKSELFGWTELAARPDDDGAGGADGAGGEAGAGGAPALGGNGKMLRTFQLPPAVCEKISEDLIASVHVTGVCETKTERLPVCGDWYSTTVTPVRPMMTGGGDMGCAEFKPGSRIPSVTGERVFDGMLQVAGDLKVAVDELAKSTFSACAGVLGELGEDAPETPTNPSPTAVRDTCTAASNALKQASQAASGSSWSVLLNAAQCGISIDEVSTCEKTCSGTDCGALARTDQRCDDLGGSCSLGCTGDCGGTPQSPVACSGSCNGVCSGSCSGGCIHEDGSVTEGDCEGWCSGTCDGTCSGLCAAEMTECDGTCWGDCRGNNSEMLCRVALRNERCLGSCGTLCAAETQLGASCTSSAATVYGVAPATLRKAIDTYYAGFADAVGRAATISAAASSVGELFATFAMEDDGKDEHRSSCLAEVGNAVNAASALLTATLDGASRAASSVTPGKGDALCVEPAIQCGGSCVDLSSSVTNCGECGHVCAAGQTCVDASCTCGAGRALCSGACVNLASDAQHCGQCGRACDDGDRCAEGECVPSADGSAEGGAEGGAGGGAGAAEGGAATSEGGTGGAGDSLGSDGSMCPVEQPETNADCTGYTGGRCVYGGMFFCDCRCPVDSPEPCQWSCTLG